MLIEILFLPLVLCPGILLEARPFFDSSYMTITTSLHMYFLQIRQLSSYVSDGWSDFFPSLFYDTSLCLKAQSQKD